VVWALAAAWRREGNREDVLTEINSWLADGTAEQVGVGLRAFVNMSRTSGPHPLDLIADADGIHGAAVGVRRACDNSDMRGDLGLLISNWLDGCEVKPERVDSLTAVLRDVVRATPVNVRRHALLEKQVVAWQSDADDENRLRRTMLGDSILESLQSVSPLVLAPSAMEE
jgi:hypothetical protein